MNHGFKFTVYLISDAEAKFKVRLKKNYKSTNTMQASATIKPAVGNQIFKLEDPSNSLC